MKICMKIYRVLGTYAPNVPSLKRTKSSCSKGSFTTTSSDEDAGMTFNLNVIIFNFCCAVVYERLFQSQKVKALELIKKKRELAQQEMEACTFMPAIPLSSVALIQPEPIHELFERLAR